MIDYLLSFANEATARADPVVGQFWTGSAWHTEFCIPGIIVSTISTGTAIDSNWRILIAQANDNASLDAHASTELIVNRDNAILSSAASAAIWALRQISPIPEGSLYPDLLAGNGLFGSPYNAQSLWKAQPVSPVLGTATIGPPANQFPFIEDGPFGTPVFKSSTTDPPMTVSAYVGDEITTRNVTIPHWPANAQPGIGSDHHLAIFDPTTGIFHTFWDAVYSNGTWTAGKYATETVNGLGFPSPSRPDGVRGGGSSNVAGLLRSWEYGQSVLNHALAFEIDQTGIHSGPVFPITEEDNGLYANVNAAGPITYGMFMMLPSTFNVSALATPAAQTIARTFMKYGGYCVDTTGGTFGIAGEVGGQWQNANVYADLVVIRDALRNVVSVSGWLDANGNSFTPTPWARMNLLSMRGPWSNYSGPAAGGAFDTAQNLYVIPATAGAQNIVRMLLYERDSTAHEPWLGWERSQQWYLTPSEGTSYKLSAIGVGSVTAQIDIKASDLSATYFTSLVLAPGQSQTFTWPNNSPTVTEVFVTKPTGAAAAIRLELQAA